MLSYIIKILYFPNFYRTKFKKFIVTFFLTKKANLEHYAHNGPKKTAFFKTFLRFSILDILKMSNFQNETLL